MLPRPARVLNAMPAQIIDWVQDYFDCAAEDDTASLPSERVAATGASHADVVLCLLIRADEPLFRRAAEALVGRRVLRCPPCLRGLAPGFHQTEDAPPEDQRRVTWISEHPGRIGGARYRHAIFRVGMTIEQFMVRGGQRRDVRIALRRGLIRLSPLRQSKSTDNRRHL